MKSIAVLLLLFTTLAMRPRPADPPVRSAAADTVVVVDNGLGATRTFTMGMLRAMPHFVLATMSKDGHAEHYEGIPLADLLRMAGASTGDSGRGRDLVRYMVQVTASDNYRASFMLPEIDPTFSDRTIMLAYLLEGKPLDAKDGPLQIIVPGEKRHARWVRGVSVIRVIKLPE